MDLRSQAPQRRATTLNRPVIIAIVGVAALVAAAAVGAGFERERAAMREEVRPDGKPKALVLPDQIAKLPGNYAQVPVAVPPATSAPAAPVPPEFQGRIAQLETRIVTLQQSLVDLQNGVERIRRIAEAPPPPPPPPARPVMAQIEEPGRSAAIFFPSGAPERARGAAAPAVGRDLPQPDAPRTGGTSAGAASPARSEAQEVASPAGGYVIQAGTIIPTNLITGINSDLQGDIVAQVRENVYDTRSGRHLLIPQGSRLIGRYDPDVAFGQDRVRLTFTRLMRPDGTSVALGNLGGAGADGTAGLGDQVDNHWGTVIAGALLSATLSVGIQSSQGNVGGFYPSVGQQAAGNAAGGVSDVGRNFAQRELARKPTIRVRSGYSFNVIVQRDLVLLPFGRD